MQGRLDGDYDPRERTMPASTASASLLLGALLQVSPGGPTPYAAYGPPEAVELSQIAAGDETHHRTMVLTKGELRPLATSLEHFLLVDGTARVLVLVVPELQDAPRRLLGRRIEVTGVVRILPSQQRTVFCRGTMMTDSKCLDPELPGLPDARIGWPPVSLTILTLSDVGPGSEAAPQTEGSQLAELALNGSRLAGQTVSVVGLFAGRNLFGDLPAGSAQGPSDWVLKQGPHAIWVTGRKPEGKGWRLDSAYKGDTVRWLEVTGRVESRGGITYVRASKVGLVSAPRVSDEER